MWTGFTYPCPALRQLPRGRLNVRLFEFVCTSQQLSRPHTTAPTLNATRTPTNFTRTASKRRRATWSMCGRFDLICVEVECWHQTCDLEAKVSVSRSTRVWFAKVLVLVSRPFMKVLALVSRPWLKVLVLVSVSGKRSWSRLFRDQDQDPIKMSKNECNKVHNFNGLRNKICEIKSHSYFPITFNLIFRHFLQNSSSGLCSRDSAPRSWSWSRDLL